jgi:hypothetical protein
VSALLHRAEHVGISLRPRELKDAYRLHSEGKLDDQRRFASTVGGNPLTEEDERAKPRRVVEVAERVCGSA